MHGAGFLLFALDCLEVVEAALACHFALKVSESVEGHACCVGPGFNVM